MHCADSFKSPPSLLQSPPSAKVPLCEIDSNNIMSSGNDYDTRPIKPSKGGWDSIRQLDDEENWSERNSVISKHDHQLHSEYAQEFVTDIINKIPIGTDSTDGAQSETTYPPPPSPYKEAVIPTSAHVIVTDDSAHNRPGDSTHMRSDEDYGYMKEFGDDEFTTTSHQLDMDYLERVSSNKTEPSALARESLFVKFDPLVGKTAPVRQPPMKPHPHITAEGGNLLMLDTPPPNYTPVTYNTPPTQIPLDTLDVNNTHDATPRSIRGSSPHSKTVFDTSSAVAQVTPTSHSTSFKTDNELVNVLIYSESDFRKAVQQVRNECEIQNEEVVSLLKVDHSEEMSKQQMKIDRLLKEMHNLKTYINIGRADKVLEAEQTNDNEELCSKYRETSTELLQAYEQLKVETKRIEEERDQCLRDFSSLERSFTDFHQRYNKSKELVTSLQKTVSELQDYIKKIENINRKIQAQNRDLQEDTAMKIQEANETYEQIKRESTSEVAVMKANAKKMTLQIASLEKQLQQKEQEKGELTLICEDLMKELSSKS